jgi:hypothetical protein
VRLVATGEENQSRRQGEQVCPQPATFNPTLRS